ncbi:MAG: hypothetical protein IK094_06050, partial [Treponema sp.]|nr:hypothetical protein [Treponema sp.]
GAFDGCSSLATVTYQGTKDQWGSVVRPALPSTWHASVPPTTMVQCLVDSESCELDWHPPLSGAYTVLPAGTTSGTAGPSGTYVTFGLWPQTVIADGVTVDKNKTKTVGSVTYYLGSDFEWYAEVAEDAYGTNNRYKYSNGNQIGQGGTTPQFFKVEPIKWRVVTDNYNGKKLLLCESAIDSKKWNESAGSYWENSTLRAWLGGEFYNAAFTSDEKSKIPQTHVDNTARSTSDDNQNDASWSSFGVNLLPNTNSGNDTDDYVFLLSIRELTRTSYGFEIWANNDSAKKRAATDYSKACNVIIGDNNGNVEWRTRSASKPNSGLESDANCRTIAETGCPSMAGSNRKQGIVPAICVNP